MKTAAALAVLLFTCAAAAAERPAVQQPREVARAELKTFKLANGLQVSFVPFGDVPKVLMYLAIDAGNLEEKEGETWLADFTGDLLEQGTETRTASELARTVAEWGGAYDVSVSVDTMYLAGTVLEEHAADLARLFSELVEKPRFPEADVARLKADLIRNLQQSESVPEEIAMTHLEGLMYPGHPYGRRHPTEAMVRGYTRDQARAFYGRLVHAGRAHLYVAGRFNAADLEQAVRDAFGDWKGGPAEPPPVPRPVSARRIHFYERAGAVQSNLRIAVPVIRPDHADYIAFRVMDNLLGGSYTSRITTNIRERKGYTYSPHSRVTARVGDTNWRQEAEVTSNVTGPALKEILKEIDLISKTPPSAQELADTQAYMIGTFLIQLSTRDGRVAWQRFLDVHGLPADFDYVAAVRAVTAEKMSEVARRYLDPAKLTIVVVGDKQVLPQLKGIAPIVKHKP